MTRKFADSNLKDQVEDYLCNCCVGRENVIGKKALTEAMFGHHTKHLERKVRAAIAEITNVAIGMSTKAGAGGYFACVTEEERADAIATLESYVKSTCVHKAHLSNAQLATASPQGQLFYMRRAG